MLPEPTSFSPEKTFILKKSKRRDPRSSKVVQLISVALTLDSTEQKHRFKQLTRITHNNHTGAGT